jgi:hypothetical protein
MGQDVTATCKMAVRVYKKQAAFFAAGIALLAQPSFVDTCQIRMTAWQIALCHSQAFSAFIELDRLYRSDVLLF